MLKYKKNKKEENKKLSQFNFSSKNKRAQIGPTLTWVLATLLIAGILAFFVFASFGVSKLKAISVGELKSDLGEESSILKGKTDIAYELNSANKEIIEEGIK